MLQQATGVINIVIDIWMLVGLHHLASTLEQHEQFIFLPPGKCPCMKPI